jgi:hypothetical protein
MTLHQFAGSRDGTDDVTHAGKARKNYRSPESLQNQRQDDTDDIAERGDMTQH